MKTVLVFFFLLNTFCFCQNIEETIYMATEAFLANPNANTYKQLTQKEIQFKQQITSKDEQLALVFLLCHKGFYLDRHSKLNQAISAFEDALYRFNRHQISTLSDFDIIESCMIPLGNLYTKTGDYTNAEITIKQYLFLAEKNKQNTHQISGTINLAKLYQTLGKHTIVIKLTSKYLNHPYASKQQKQKILDIKKDSEIALGLIPNTQNISSALNNDIKYKLALQNKAYKLALTLFKKKKSKLLLKTKLAPRHVAKLYFEEAQIHSLLNQKDSANTSLNAAIKTLIPELNPSALPPQNQLYAENTFIDIFDLKANIATNPLKALQYYDLSFYVSKLLRRAWTSQETKILNQTTDRIRSEKCLDILSELYDQTKNKTLLFKALQYTEQTKASSLRDMFLKTLRLKKHPNDTLLQKEFKLIKKQEQLTHLLISEQLEHSQVLKINEYNKRLSAISLELKLLNKSIITKYPTPQTPFTLNQLQLKLQQDQAILLEYFYGKNSIYQFTVSPNNISLVHLPKDTLTEQKIVSFINLFNAPKNINNNIDSFTKQAFNIYQLLNLKSLQNSKNVIVIPDGLLNFIPFDALLEQDTSTIVFSKMPFVVFSNNLIFNSSIITYLNSTSSLEKQNVLGFFPVFENTDQMLNFSIDEASAIKKEMSATILMNETASKQNFINKNSDYDILHLSTHARSGDFVTPASLSFFDNPLFLNELYSLNIKAHLAVLSACETGIGKLYKSEGPMSIARGFQYSGVQNVLFSLWQINDLSTSKLMQTFYSKYSKHQSAFIANAQSKIEYLKNESISNIKKSPYYWSAFVYYGAIERPKTEKFLFYILLGILIIFINLFLLFKNRKYDRNRVSE